MINYQAAKTLEPCNTVLNILFTSYKSLVMMTVL